MRKLIWIILSCFLIFPSLVFAKQDCIRSVNTIIEKEKELRWLKIPNSLILSQVVLESGFCSSVLARKHNNVLGIRNGSGFKRFKSVSDCISYYYTLMEESEYYKDVRTLISSGITNPFRLIKSTSFLVYSGNDSSYQEKLRSIILSNELTEWDT